MDPRDARAALEGAELTPAGQGSLQEVKRLVDRCLDAGIPALLGGDHACGCGTGGCGPKAQLYLRPADLPRLAELLERDWLAAAEAEGTADPEWIAKLRGASHDPDAEPPCPACGTQAPLVEGACSDCGLQLA